MVHIATQSTLARVVGHAGKLQTSESANKHGMSAPEAQPPHSVTPLLRNLFVQIAATPRFCSIDLNRMRAHNCH